MNYKKQFGPWHVEYMPLDGGRISRLKYVDIDILTVRPNIFMPPKKKYGRYETRPVYGYDDCFPSIDPCIYPGSRWIIPDHGEVCWLEFSHHKGENYLLFEVESKNLPVRLYREMIFGEDNLVWSFKVENLGENNLPFQHVVHPLMPLRNITDLKFPEYESLFDDINKKDISLDGTSSLKEFLLSRPLGSTHMLFARNINSGKMSWEFLDKIRITAEFSSELFPSIGIWWNNEKYPDEDNCRRSECAFEPVPGLNSRLTDAIKDGMELMVSPGDIFEWKIVWHLNII
jgi:hypothetical protein